MNQIFNNTLKCQNSARIFRVIAEIAWWSVAGVFIFSTLILDGGNDLKTSIFLTAFFLVFARYCWGKLATAWSDGWKEKFFGTTMENPAPASKFDFRVAATLFALFTVVILLTQNPCTDFKNQWNQILTGEYNDWHPLPHTFFIWLTTCLWRAPVCFFIVQAAIYACVLAALFGVLQNTCFFKRKIALGIVAIAALHPAYLGWLGTGTKDVSMLVALVAATACVIEIVMTRGERLRSPVVFCAFAVSVLAGTLFRHNAIFFTIPLLATLPFCIEKKHWLRYGAAVACIVIAFVGTKFYIEKNFPKRFEIVSQTYGETIGVPFAMLANIAKNDPDQLPPDARAFVENIAPLEVWQRYELGNANSGLKWEAPISRNLRKELAKLPPEKFLKMMLETVRAAPGKCATVFIHHVFYFWRLNSWPGTWVAILLFSGIFAFPILKWKVLPLTLPTFLYQAGTSLLMYGVNDARFYFYAIPVSLASTALIFALLRKSEN